MTPARTALVEAEETVWLRTSTALPAAARREAAALARRLGFAAPRAAEIELAVTEAATNLQRHADDGALALRIVTHPERAAVEFLSLDTGPGMSDVALSIADGASTSGTLGVGLGAITRLADTFDIHSVPGRGTALLARFWTPTPPPAPGKAVRAVGGLTRPLGGESVCGDTWAARLNADGPGPCTVMMCDGLGHGPLAARASERARHAFRASRHEGPREILEDIHTALKGTRGAAVSVARLDPDRGRVEYCGAGNISGFVVDSTRQPLVSLPGIVGHQLPLLRVFEAALTPASVLVLHSDGLVDRWRFLDFPGLLTRQPTVIAAQILGDAGVRRDDAGIVVLGAEAH